MTVAYLDDIDRVQHKFTELGQTIEEASKQHTGYFKDTVDTLSKGFDELNALFVDPSFLNARDAAHVIDFRVTEMSDLFGKVLASVATSFATMITTSEDAHKGITQIAEGLKTAVERSSAQAKGAAGGPVLILMQREKEKKPGVLQKELRSLKASASSMMGKLKLPKPGTILAGGVMAAAYGFMYKDRIQKEMGEVKNTLESAADYGMKSVRRKGVAAFSALQENLQRYSGIAKGEVQAITKTLSQGGVGITEMLDDVNKKFGRVGKSAVHSSLALDKMFGVPGGTMAQKAVGYMHNYGMSLKEANEMTRDLHLNDQAFKIGVPTFVHNVETAAESLKDLGFSIRGVMDVAGGLQERFEKIGVPKQFAGKMAGLGVQQMAQGIASMSDDWKVFMGQKMSGGKVKGLEALQKFEEGFTRVKEGGGVEEYKELAIQMYQVAKDVNEGDEAQMYAFMSRNMGLGSQGARATMEIGKVFEEKGGIAAIKATEGHMKTFKQAFETEKEKDSKFRRNMNKWMEGISDVGQGLLSLAGKAVAYLIALFRAYPSMFASMMTMDWERAARIQQKVTGMMGGWRDDWNKMKEGFSKMGDAGKKMFGDIAGSSMAALASSFTMDLTGKGASTPEQGDTPRDFSTRTPLVRTVYIPIDSQVVNQTYPVEVKKAKEMKAMQLARQGIGMWVGGRLSIVNRGVDEHGNIGLDIVGHCPRCGLGFGGGMSGMGVEGGPIEASAEDEEALARMIQTEAGSSTAHGKGKAGVSKGRQAEAAMIGMTALNRLRDKKKRYGKSLHEVITGTQGGGYGKQGSEGRAYGTARKASDDSRRIARKILEGNAGVDSGGATYFYHSHPGKEMVRGGKSLALPPFTQSRANVANIALPAGKYKGEGHYARFYADKADAPGGDVESRAGIDEFLKEEHAERHKNPVRGGGVKKKQTFPEMM